MKPNQFIEDVRTNTISECFYCTKENKDCYVCEWQGLVQRLARKG